jgi:hypothetical protein
MENGVIKFEEECYVELFQNGEDKENFYKITEEQFELVNKILQETSAKFIQIGNTTFNVNSIRTVYKKPVQREIPANSTIIEPEITPEQRKKNLEALDKLREQLKNNRTI